MMCVRTLQEQQHPPTWSLRRLVKTYRPIEHDLPFNRQCIPHSIQIQTNWCPKSDVPSFPKYGNSNTDSTLKTVSQVFHLTCINIYNKNSKLMLPARLKQLMWTNQTNLETFRSILGKLRYTKWYEVSLINCSPQQQFTCY